MASLVVLPPASRVSPMDPGASSGGGRAGFQRACRLPNTVHSEVLPSLPLPTLPRELGFDPLRDDEPLAVPDLQDMIMQAGNSARILADTDVSLLGITPKKDNVEVDPSRLWRDVLEHNPDAFKVKAPGSSLQGHYIHSSASQPRNKKGRFMKARTPRHDFKEKVSIRIRVNREDCGQSEATTEKVADLKNTVDETKSVCEELQKQRASLQEALKMAKAEKMDALRSLADEKEARMVLESLRNGLLEDLNRANLEDKRLNDQNKMLQDKNKRLQEYNTSLLQCNSNLQADAAKNAETIAKLQKEKDNMVETMSGLKDQLDIAKSLQDEAAKQKTYLLKEVESLRMELQHVREDRDTRSAQVVSLLADIETYKEMTGKTAVQLDSAFAETSALEETCVSQRKMIETLEIKLTAANEKLKRSDMTASETMIEYENVKKRLDEAKQTIQDGEKLRKKLHNTIHELKGNIRVFCRVRPLLPNESGAVSYPKSGENIGRGIEMLHNEQAYSFTFDKVFDHSASQEQVFIEISQLVQSAIDGYKVCIFAYGQTGSGKTYTMMGNPEFEDQKGMIPRSLEQIFQARETLNLQGWRYKMQASMLEIYNETIRDLLATNRMAAQDGGPSKYTIKHDSNGNTNVSDLKVVDVTSIEEVSSLLRRAAQSRSVGSTRMNEESSRSHSVLTLRIFGVNEGRDQRVQGVLNLVDLAGSERLKRSGATSDRLKETQAINKSLHCLSDVIFSITKKEKHVPFRNSKLTHLLEPCLAGDSKMLMFVNLSPEVSSTGESLCSLRFAAKVNSCEIGIARRQTQMRSSH